MSINIDNFDKEIMKLFENCIEQKKQIVEKELDTYAKDLTKEIKEKSPKRTGKYSKSWTITHKSGGVRVIHNKSHYQLTHLLEKGFYHVRKKDQIQPKPHIRPAFDNTVNQFFSQLKNKLN